MGEDESRAKGFVNDPEWEEMMSQMSVYFERLAFVRSAPGILSPAWSLA